MNYNFFILPTIKFFIAVIVGALIGWDREKKGKPAGLKTHALVCLGATVVTQIGILIVENYGMGDPTRIAAQIVSGIGFLGAGVIMTRSDNRIVGLTTAATLWFCGCMGICIGSNYYYLAIPAFIAYYFISHILIRLENHEGEIEDSKK